MSVTAVDLSNHGYNKIILNKLQAMLLCYNIKARYTLNYLYVKYGDVSCVYDITNCIDYPVYKFIREKLLCV